MWKPTTRQHFRLQTCCKIYNFLRIYPSLFKTNKKKIPCSIWCFKTTAFNKKTVCLVQATKQQASFSLTDCTVCERARTHVHAADSSPHIVINCSIVFDSVHLQTRQQLFCSGSGSSSSQWESEVVIYSPRHADGGGGETIKSACLNAPE